MTDLVSIDRPLWPVADQHVAARRRKLWAVFLEAGQNGKIALIHLAAETLHIAGACLLLLLRAAMSLGARQNRDGQQDKRQEEFVHVSPPTDFRQPSDASSPVSFISGTRIAPVKTIQYSFIFGKLVECFFRDDSSVTDKHPWHAGPAPVQISERIPMPFKRVLTTRVILNVFEN
jgi:hypothetical protein